MGTFKLWKKTKGKDYKFIDKMIGQQFEVGATGIFVHKYLGPVPQNESNDKTISDNPVSNETTIQDVLFLENRDRKYEKDVTEVKGHYTISDIEFNLTQFGAMISSPMVFITFHTNDMVERLGRRLMSGDVLELWHRRDDLLLDEEASPINAFYVVKEASRSAEGYGPTWYPHLWRCKCEPLKDSQEYRDILNKLKEEGFEVSNERKFKDISELIDQQNDADVSKDNFDSSHLYVDPQGDIPGDNLINYFFNGDGIPPNSDVEAPSGNFFPEDAQTGEYFIRTDYSPPRLFRKEDCKWRMIETVWRQPYQPARRTLEEFVDNNEEADFGPMSEQKEKSRKAVSKVIPKKDQQGPDPDDNC